MEIHQHSNGGFLEIAIVMQGGAEILAKQTGHILVLGIGPGTLQETDMTAPGGDGNGHVCRMLRLRDRNGCIILASNNPLVNQAWICLHIFE